MAVHSTSMQPPSSSSKALPSSSHRLPTVSASEALKSLRSSGPRAIPTGIRQLDTLLGSEHGGTDASKSTNNGAGIARGSVTQLWGPSGAGKTTLAMQVAANALGTGSKVVWVDTTSALVHSRFADVLYATAASDDISKHLDDYHHYTAPTLAHLLALILHPPKGFPPANTSLLVIDDLHTLFNISYPRYYSSTAGNKSESAKWAAGRRYSVQGTVMTALKKLAGLYDMAVLVTTGCATRVRAGSGLGAVLVPGVSGTEWDSGVSARLVLFRDLAPRQTASASQNGSARDSVRSARYIGFQQIGALAEDGDVGQVVSFKIGKNGIEETLQPQATTDRGVVQLPRPIPSPVKTRKRKVEEIADSDEEISSEYGWLDEDEVVAEGLIDEAALEEGEEEPAARLPIDEAAPEEGAEEPLVPQEG